MSRVGDLLPLLLRTKTAVVLKDAFVTAGHELQGQDCGLDGFIEKVKCFSAAAQLKAAETQPPDAAFLFLYQRWLIVTFHFLCALEWICVQYLIC